MRALDEIYQSVYRANLTRQSTTFPSVDSYVRIGFNATNYEVLGDYNDIYGREYCLCGGCGLCKHPQFVRYAGCCHLIIALGFRWMTLLLETSETPCLDGGFSSIGSTPSPERPMSPPSLKSKVASLSTYFPVPAHDSFPEIIHSFSVSSVKTLENAKAMKDCWYMPIPVQAVSTVDTLARTVLMILLILSMVHCSSVSFRRFSTSDIMRASKCLRTGRPLGIFRLASRRGSKGQTRRRRRVEAYGGTQSEINENDITFTTHQLIPKLLIEPMVA